MRQHCEPLACVEHLQYRSTYGPVKGVIDGDLLERLHTLSKDLRGLVEVTMEEEQKKYNRFAALYGDPVVDFPSLEEAVETMRVRGTPL